MLAVALSWAALSLLAPGQAAAEEESGCTITLSSVCPGTAPAPEPEPSPSTTTTTAPPEPTPAEAAAKLLSLANEARAEAGVAPLAARADVAEIAQGWSETMSRNGSLSHNDEYFSAATKERLDAGLRGENVAYAGGVEQAHRALMDSAPHRANLLDARFSVVGMGAVYVDGTWWVTQDFLQPRTPAAPAGPAAPAPASPVAEERARALPAAEQAEVSSGSSEEVAVLSASPAVPEPLETAAPMQQSARTAEGSGTPAAASMLPVALVALALAAAVGIGMLVLR